MSARLAIGRKGGCIVTAFHWDEYNFNNNNNEKAGYNEIVFVQ